MNVVKCYTIKKIFLKKYWQIKKDMLYYICKVDKDNENKIIKFFKKLKK